MTALYDLTQTMDIGSKRMPIHHAILTQWEWNRRYAFTGDPLNDLFCVMSRHNHHLTTTNKHILIEEIVHAMLYCTDFTLIEDNDNDERLSEYPAIDLNELFRQCDTGQEYEGVVSRILSPEEFTAHYLMYDPPEYTYEVVDGRFSDIRHALDLLWRKG